MTKVKICGLQSPEDIAAVNRYRPDYAGFVFAPSRRQITAETARCFRQQLHPEIKAVGVFVNAHRLDIVKMVSAGIIDIIQLHGDEDDAYRQELQHQVSCPVIQAVSVGEFIPSLLPEFADFLLFDTFSDRQRGGTGHTFDWSVLKGIDRPFYLAGGLNPNNVEKAVALTSPYCVDTSSGVETAGQKDPEKIRRFIEAVRR